VKNIAISSKIKCKETKLCKKSSVRLKCLLVAGAKYLQVFQKWEVLKGIWIYVIQVSKISNFTVKKGGTLPD